MRAIRGIVATLVACALSFAHIATAETPVERARDWLSGQVGANGTLASEAASVALPVASRAEALHALSLVTAAPSALADAITQDGAVPTELVARRAVALAAAQRDASALSGALAARQSADGGIAPAPGYWPTAIDTAWFLLSCKAAACPQTAVANAVSFLRAAQGGDGSFGVLGESSVAVTSLALAGLQAHAGAHDVAQPAAAARAWLLGARSQGHYGSTFHNALAVLALAAGVPDPAPLASPQEALRLAQAADGSWAGDPFLTALAMRALLAGGSLPLAPGFHGLVVEQASGAPLEGVTVSASGPQSASVATGASGAFSLTGLAAGAYTIQFTLPGYLGATAQASVLATVGTDLGTIRLPLSPTSAVLEGTVRDGTTGSGLADATVGVTGGATAAATTDANGDYRLVGLAPGSVTLVASKTGYQSSSASGTLVAGGTLVFSPGLYPAGQVPTTATLTGKVVDASSLAPVAGATLTVGGNSTIAGADGSFSLPGLPAGAFALEVAAAGYVAASYSGVAVNGVNDVGNLAIARAPTSVTLSGRILDRATGAPLGGAQVGVAGTALGAVTDVDGRYAIPGIATASFTVGVTAAGYASRSIAVTLQPFADATLDVPLDKVVASTLALRRVATDRVSYGAYESIEFLAEAQNTGTSAILASFAASIFDAQNRLVEEVPAIRLVFGQSPSEVLIAIDALSQREVAIEWPNGSLAPGNYSAIVRAQSASGEILAEGTAAFSITTTRRISAGVGLEPPLAVAADSRPVAVKATIFNQGNVDLAAGPVQLSVTLEAADTNVPPAPTYTYTPVTQGSPVASPAGIARDVAGNLYVVNYTDRKIHRIAPDGQVSLLIQLDTYYSLGVSRLMSPVAIDTDDAGNLYVLSSYAGLLVKISPALVATPMLVGVDSPVAFDVAGDGTVHTLGSTGGVPVVTRIPAGGGSASVVVNARGLYAPSGIAYANGYFHVANSSDNSISRIDAQGQVMPYLTGIASPLGLVADASGTLFVVSAGKIYRVANGVATLHATGFTNPQQLTIDAAGNLFVADQDNTVKKVTPAGVVTTFAQAIVHDPTALAYDGSGNLYAAGTGGRISRLDAAETVTEVKSGLGTLRSMILAPSGDLVATEYTNPGRVISVAPSGNVTALATGLRYPAGVAFDGSGVLHATIWADSQIAEISGGAAIARLQSYVTNPQAVHVVSDTEMYVLNNSNITRLTGGGGGSVFATGFSAYAMASRAGGGFILQESNAVRAVSASGQVSTWKVSLPGLATGVAEDASGRAIVAEYSSRWVRKVDSAGVVTDVAQLAGTPYAVTGNGQGGAFILLNDGRLFEITAAGSAEPRPTIAGAYTLALDPVAQVLYFRTVTGVSRLTLSTNAIAPVVARTGLDALGVSPSGNIVALDIQTLEIITFSPAGTELSTIAGFANPTAIAWDGSRFVFAASTGVLAWTPGQYARRLSGLVVENLVAHAGQVHAVAGSGVQVLSGDTFLPFYSAPAGFVSMRGFARRADGGFAVASRSDSRVLVNDAAGNLQATYAGLVSPSGLAAAGDGRLWVATPGTSQLVRLEPDGKRSQVMATSVNYRGLAFDAAGQLHGTDSNQIYRIDTATGARTLIGTSTGTTALQQIAFGPAGTFTTDSSSSVVRALSGSQVQVFAAGLYFPNAIRLGPDGRVYVANDNATITTWANGAFGVFASSVPNVRSMDRTSSGRFYLGRSDGRFMAVEPDGTASEFASLGKLTPSGTSIDAVEVAPDGKLHFASRAQNLVGRFTVTQPPSFPPAGTVLHTAGGTMPAMAAGSGSGAEVDFGTWTPPYAGDFRFTVRPQQAGVDGLGVNNLHVGAAAQGALSANRAVVAPGDAPLRLTVNTKGADFTSVARVDKASLVRSIATQGYVNTMGADASGNVYYAVGANVRRVTATGADSVFFTSANTISMRGMIPVDDAQNVYVSAGADGKTILRIAPDGLSSQPFATLGEAIVSMVMNAQEEIFALTATRVYRVGRQGEVGVYSIAGVTSGYAITTDGAGNLYVQNWNNVINRISPSGVTTVLPGVSFEYEGVTLAGGCDASLFVTAINFPAIGQVSGEEHVLGQVNGITGAATAVLDGRQVHRDLLDMDFLVYDRFSRQLLIWTDIGSRLFRLPVRCGAIDADLHLVFPAGQPASGASVAPVARKLRADGSVELVWNLKSVTVAGRDVSLDTVLAGMKLAESRPVVKEAFLSFKNSFAPGDVTVPVAVPSVATDGLLDLAVSASPVSYGANEDVASEVRVTSRDSAGRTASLAVEFVDAQGGVVAAAPEQTVAVGAGQEVVFTPAFNTGTTLAGAYAVRARLAEPAHGAELARGEAGFDIVAAAGSLTSSVSTDRPAYEPFAKVYATGRAKNLSVNLVASNLVTALRILGPGGTVMLDQGRAVPQLVPGAFKDSVFELQLQSAPPGTYSVEERLLDAGGGLQDQKQASFTVLSTADTGTGLAGALNAVRKANAGTPIALNTFLENKGNAAIADMPAVVRVTNPASGAVVAEFSFTQSVSPGQSEVRTFSWNTTGVSTGTYTAVYSGTVGGRAIAFGQESIQVGALVPFAFAPRVGVVPGSVVESNPVTIAGLVLPAAIGVSGGEYRVNAGPWTSAAGTVAAGDQLLVRLTASAGYGELRSATVTVAGHAATFDVTTATPDLTPDPFAFAPRSDVPFSTAITSEAVTITGIDAPVPIRITGGEYSVNDAAFTSAQGTVTAGSAVVVRLTSAATLGTATSATLEVSGVFGTFTATTTSADSTPDPFAFAPQSNVPVASVRTSETVTITGINVAVPVSVAGGEYSVNGGPFTAADGTIRGGDTLALRLTASAAYGATKSVNVTVSQFSTGFAVTTQGLQPPEVTHAFPRDSRVLVLLSCIGGNAEACVEQRRAFLEGFLGSVGVEHRIVTTTEEFGAELRCGRWNTYWISGGSAKLKGTLPQELRAAVLRGDALLQDGEHDQRNAFLDEVTGVKFKGSPPVPATVLLTGPMFPAGSFAYPLGWEVRVDLQGGTAAAYFGSTSGEIAIVTNAFGAGRAMQFTFDYLGALMAASGNGITRAVFESALDWTAPAAPTRFTADGWVAVTTTLHNPNSEPQEIELLASLPAGMSFTSSVPVPVSASASAVTWRVGLAANETRAIEWAARAPQATGTVSIGFQAARIEGGTATPVGTSSLAVEVLAAAQAGPQLVTALNALTLSTTAQRSARDRAVAALLEAHARLANSLFEGAIAKYAEALAETDTIPGIALEIEVGIAGLLQEAERGLCSGGKACAVGTATGSAYGLLVFGSASLAGDSTGSVGIGGAGALGNFTAASLLTGDAARVVVGGSLTWSQGTVGQGGSGVIRVAGSQAVAAGVGRRELTTASVEDWAALRADQLARADRYAALAGTAATVSGGSVACSGTNATFNVCAIAASQLTGAQAIDLAYPATASVVVNLTGTGPLDFGAGQTRWNGQPLQGHAAARQVLFNAAQATSMTIDGWAWGGSLLAPRATVTHRNGFVDGQAVFNTLTSTGSFRCSGTYQGQLQ